jgi:hypothetical protein
VSFWQQLRAEKLHDGRIELLVKRGMIEAGRALADLRP